MLADVEVKGQIVPKSNDFWGRLRGSQTHKLITVDYRDMLSERQHVYVVLAG